MSDRTTGTRNSGLGVIFPLILSLSLGLSAPAAATDLTLDAAVHNPQRSVKFVARDSVRHPLEELAFFGVAPQSTVVEIWPGGGYWTEILAPFLHDRGVYYAALEGKQASETATAGAERNNAAFRQKIGSDPATYGKVIPTVLGVDETDIAPAGSADVVLTFRNLHNWLKQGYASEAFAAFYRALKPGGVLGTRITVARGIFRRILRPPMATSVRITPSRWPRRRGSLSRAPPRSTPTRRTPPTGPRASGRCRRPSGSATRTRPSTPPSGKRTISC